ncbi:MAG: hypothetical protein HYY52_06275 [Candidatus Melainabacteria bacterium]|nr:hypothetical protein [Candidatus Melainabacteria bacterium]
MGRFVLVVALLFYVLVKLPFDLSVVCSSGNEGFYFVYGQKLLEGRHLYTDILSVRGPFFILIYAVLVKLFGFNTNALVALHFFHTVVIFLTSNLIYFILKKLSLNPLVSAIGVFLWVLLQLSSNGLWGSQLELESSLSFEAEYLCNLFSLSSIFCLLAAFEKPERRKFNVLLSVIASFVSFSSAMFKASGLVIVLATFLWVGYLFLFAKDVFRVNRLTVCSYIFGIIVFFLVFSIGIYNYNGNFNSFFDSYFLFGNYSIEGRRGCSLLIRILKFMFRHTDSISNFILFFISFLFLIWGLLSQFFIGEKIFNRHAKVFLVLISAWGIGNICSVIVSGNYASYYYVLVWPSIAILLVTGFQYLTIKFGFLNLPLSRYLLAVFLILFFICRFSQLYPAYTGMAKEHLSLSFFNQPQSFQDPVLSYDPNKNKRSPVLQMADRINNYLPNKNDSFYIFAFAQGHQSFGPPIYIYVKRPCTSAITSDWLHYEKFLNTTIPILTKQLYETPPKILIIPRVAHLGLWQVRLLKPFFVVLNDFISKNYHLKDSVSYICYGLKEPDVYDVFERN